MDCRLNVVTLGVADLDRARTFYTEVLGWTPARQSVGDVVFFQAGGVVVALYPRGLLAEDARVSDPGAHGFGGMTLAQNVAAREDVDRVLADVAARGGRILRPAEDAFWGGRTGYFADPDGHPWEVAWNPGFPLDRSGVVRLEPPRRPARAPRPARPSPRRTSGRRRAASAEGATRRRKKSATRRFSRT